MKKPKVIYITGSGHSGSTLLDMILGSSETCISLGELEFLRDFVEDREPPENVKHPLSTCLCGKEFEKCEFWRNVVKKTDIEKTYDYKSTFFEKIKLALSIYFPFIKIKFNYDDEELLQYILIQATKQKGKEVEYIVDSSKDLRRLIYLNSLTGIDLKVIHLVRDSRGVVNSFEKRGRKGWKVMLEWIAENILIGKFLKSKVKKRNYIRMSYYYFTKNPKKQLERVNKKWGIKIDLENFIQKVNSEEYHHISGNPLNMRELKGIRRDVLWKERFPSWKKKLIGTITFVWNKKLVYKKWKRR